jgi:uncharacterized LabA/DUF88 family protein
MALTGRAMVFIDGTNFFHRLMATRTKLHSGIYDFIFSQVLAHTAPHRIYLYSTKPQVERAVGLHGDRLLRHVRVVYGDSVLKADGNAKEKGVDALLVADLIYHAAAKNYDVAYLVSTDSDFAHALRRVEDFGARTMLVSFGATPPELLRDAADRYLILDPDQLLRIDVVKRLALEGD